MASLNTDSRGFRRIQFVDQDGLRKSVRLGRTPVKTCEAIKVHVEALVGAKAGNSSPDPRTAHWLTGISADLLDKLAAVGLAERRGRAILGAFVAGYIAGRTDAKPSTVVNLKHAERYLLEHFGEARGMATITPGDADDYKRWLMGKIGDNTARRMLGRAKQFFRAAVRKRLITENPFDGMKGTVVQANAARQRFISRDTATKVLEACPNGQWRLLFALARYGGLRTPSEPLALTWGDVDWERGRLRVTCVKTAHHEGHAERWIPLFPELRPYLEAEFDAAAPGEFVIVNRNSAKNWRTTMNRIIKRAGFEPWGKTFQNCRSTRETELLEQYPIHVVAQWMGHSPTIALKHYTQTTDEHFAKAVEVVAHPVAQTAPAEAGRRETAENENRELSRVG